MSQVLTTLWRPSNTDKVALPERMRFILLDSLKIMQPGSSMTDAQLDFGCDANTVLRDFIDLLAPLNTHALGEPIVKELPYVIGGMWTAMSFTTMHLGASVKGTRGLRRVPNPPHPCSIRGPRHVMCTHSHGAPHAQSVLEVVIAPMSVFR